jgi:hypothetical protein
VSSSGLRTCSEAVCDELGPSVLRPTARAETRHLDHSLRREAATTCAGSSMAAGDDERRRRHSAEKRQRVIRPGCRSLGRLRAVRSAPRLLTRVSMPPRPRGGCLFCSRNRSRACLRLGHRFQTRARWRLLVERFAWSLSNLGTGALAAPPRPASHVSRLRAPPRRSGAHAPRLDRRLETLIDPTYDFNQTARPSTPCTHRLHIVNAHAHVKLR